MVDLAYGTFTLLILAVAYRVGGWPALGLVALLMIWTAVGVSRTFRHLTLRR